MQRRLQLQFESRLPIQPEFIQHAPFNPVFTFYGAPFDILLFLAFGLQRALEACLGCLNVLLLYGVRAASRSNGEPVPAPAAVSDEQILARLGLAQLALCSREFDEVRVAGEYLESRDGREV